MPTAPLTRNLLVLAALGGLLGFQSFRPAAARPAPLPQDPAGAPSTVPASITVYGAVGVPGVEEMLERLPFAAQPLGIAPEFVINTLSLPRISPDAGVFPAPQAPTRPLVLNGHGDFHHLTYFVARDFVEPMGVDYTLVNFDGHDDARSAWGNKGPDDGLDCGNWSRFALMRLPHLRRIVQIGRALNYTDLASWLAPETIAAGRFDLYPAHPLTFFFDGRPNLGAFDGVARRDVLVPRAYQLEPRTWPQLGPGFPDRIPTHAVYLTVDLDVVRPEDFDDLSWGTGSVARDQIIASIAAIAKEHLIIGADITGFPPDSRKSFSYPRCLDTYQRIAQALADALAAGEPK